MKQLMPFLLVDDPRFDLHQAVGQHPERPERLQAARAGFRQGIGDAEPELLPPRLATASELNSTHTTAYVEQLDAVLSRREFGQLDADTFVAPDTRRAAWLAAGGAASMAVSLLQGEHRRGFALIRPPGHHAEPDRAMGFCLLNNVAIAATAAKANGAERVAIIDWDVHHGNGTQHAFEADSDVLVISLHQWPLYPGTGAPKEVGVGAGVGWTANLALPSGSDDAVYATAFDEVVLPMLAEHAPDLVLVSAGYDAHGRDPLAAMELSSEGYAGMTSALVRAVDDLGHGRLGFVLEGGYDLQALESSVAATVRAARGGSVPLAEGSIPSGAREAIDETLEALRSAGRRL